MSETSLHLLSSPLKCVQVDDCLILMLGDKSPEELESLCSKKNLLIEVHDRDPKPEPSTFKLISPGSAGAQCASAQP